MPKTMKALSIRQPWAWLITHGIKDVENRTWPTQYRGEFLIHAGKQADHRAFNSLKKMGITLPDNIGYGGIVGAVTLVDCVESHPSPWAQGPYIYVLENPKHFPLQPMPGKLRFFHVDAQDLPASLLIRLSYTGLVK